MSQRQAAQEVNFDGLVGPTHNYAALAVGNVAAQKSGQSVSHPRQAALQGLAKMKLLMDLGLTQGVLPPQERPDVVALRHLGFTGTDAQILEKAGREAPRLLAACSSASAMWAANAATVSPSADTRDGKVHFTAANLANHLHRALETPTTAAVLRAMFPDPETFVHHDPLPSALEFFDEGAANHTRLCASAGGQGLEVFTFGRSALETGMSQPSRFPARQSLEASQAIARLHQLDLQHTVFAQQNPAAIDAGVFHNDVIAVGHLNVLLCHQQAYVDQPAVLLDLRRRFAAITGRELTVIEVPASLISLQTAVESYLFNSQLVSLPDGSLLLIAAQECQKIVEVRQFLEELTAREDQPIRAVKFVDVRQSMRNGGGPACLRLRVVLTDDEWRKVHPGVLLTESLYARLVEWVRKHYREELRSADLPDPKLLNESCAALDELTRILNLGSLFQFQR